MCQNVKINNAKRERERREKRREENTIFRMKLLSETEMPIKGDGKRKMYQERSWLPRIDNPRPLLGQQGRQGFWRLAKSHSELAKPIKISIRGLLARSLYKISIRASLTHVGKISARDLLARSQQISMMLYAMSVQDRFKRGALARSLYKISIRGLLARSLYKISIRASLTHVGKISARDLLARSQQISMMLYAMSVQDRFKRGALARSLYKISIRGLLARSLYKISIRASLTHVGKISARDLLARSQQISMMLYAMSVQDRFKRGALARSLYKISIRGLLARSLYKISIRASLTHVGKISARDLLARSQQISMMLYAMSVQDRFKRGALARSLYKISIRGLLARLLKRSPYKLSIRALLARSL